MGFAYGYIYDYNKLEEHVDRYAPQNKNRDGFELTTRAERIAVFEAIGRAINDGGRGLQDISYGLSSSNGSQPFLVDAERAHLEDVSHLVATLKPVGAAAATLLLLFYGFCWGYKERLQRYFWRPMGLGLATAQIAVLVAIGIGVTFAIGPQKVFYILHEWAFTDKAQWFFYYQESLMTTLMPEVVFANIAVLIAGLAVAFWIAINTMVARLLA